MNKQAQVRGNRVERAKLTDAGAVSPIAQMKGRIASAFGTSVETIRISKVGRNERASAIHCWGWSTQAPFFAKVLVAPTFPRLTPIVIPGDELLGGRQELCTAQEQIRTELDTAERFEMLAGPVQIPRLLAHSLPDRVMVWSWVKGTTLDRLLRSSRVSSQAGRSLLAALKRVGIWARELHNQFRDGETTVQLDACDHALARYSAGMARRDREHVEAARRILQLTAERIGVSAIEFPATLTHGDLAPPNIIWDEKEHVATVVDFEHCQPRCLLHDLVLLIATLRSKLLNPLIPDGVIRAAEDEFWQGYGSVSRELRIATEGLASAWLLYRFLPGVSKRAGWTQPGRRILVAAYRGVFEAGRARRTMRRLTDALAAIE